MLNESFESNSKLKHVQLASPSQNGKTTLAVFNIILLCMQPQVKRGLGSHTVSLDIRFLSVKMPTWFLHMALLIKMNCLFYGNVYLFSIQKRNNFKDILDYVILLLKVLPITFHCNCNGIQMIFVVYTTGYDVIPAPASSSFTLPSFLVFPPLVLFTLLPQARAVCSAWTTPPQCSGTLSSCRSQVKCPNLREAFSKYPIQSCPLPASISLYPTVLLYFLPRIQYY